MSSTYDNLADSSYGLDKSVFKQSQLNSRSVLSGETNQMIQDYYTSDSAKVRHEDDDEEGGAGLGVSELVQNIPRQHHLQDHSQVNFQGIDSRYNQAYLQYSSNQPPSVESNLLYSNLPPQDAGKLAKEDLFYKQIAAQNYEEDKQFERDITSQRHLEDEMVHVQSNKQFQTGRFTIGGQGENQARNTVEQQSANEIEKYKKTNEEIQNVLNRLKIHQGMPPNTQYGPSNSYYQQIDPSRDLFAAHNYANSQGSGLGEGPTHYRLNKDNSIYEIAKMQNSNGSNSDNTCNMHSVLDKDYLNMAGNPLQRDFSPLEQSAFQIPEHQLQIPISQFSQQIPAQYNVILPGQKLNQQYARPQQQVPLVTQQQRLPNPPLKMMTQQPVQNSAVYHQKTFVQGEQQKYFQQQEEQQNQQDNLSKTNQLKLQNLSTPQKKQVELVKKIDEIPIHQFHKENKETDQTIESSTEIEDEERVTLIERADHNKWKIRQKAYKEISDLFYQQYQIDSDKQRSIPEEEEAMSYFDQYAHILERIIIDSNLAAQFEGLNCLYSFVRYAPDLKQVIFTLHVILLEKIQLNKPNLREITMKILLTMIKRDKTSILGPELFKRFKNKNLKIATFAMEVVVEALKNQLYHEESKLKDIFRNVAEQVGHTNKDIREKSLELVKEIYKLCKDDAATVTKNLKSLRPIQAKEIKDILQDIEKHPTSQQIFIFQKEQTISHNEGHTPKKQQSNKFDSADISSAPSQKHESVDKQYDLQPEQLEVDLNNFITDEFKEIPYISQINTKKKVMETFNQELEKIANRKANFTVANKDYSLIYNVVTHMLEDSNSLVFMEAIKTTEYLAIIMGKNFKKIKNFLALLTDKVNSNFNNLSIQYKETKTAPVQAVNKAIGMILLRNAISFTSFVEYMVCQVAIYNKNSRVKQLTLEKVDQAFQDQVKNLKEEEIINMFKAIKDKLIGLIQKDTNAGVRDAAVLLLTTFKALLQENFIVNEAINTLPKYRVAEIFKEAMEKRKLLVFIPESKSIASSAQSVRPQTAQSHLHQMQDQVDLIGQLRMLSQHGVIQKCNIEQLTQQWDEALEQMGDQVKEQKPLIVATVHQLLLQIRVDFKGGNAQVLEALLQLIKKVFCIERSVERNPQTGFSLELEHAIEIALYSVTVLGEQSLKQPETLLNVLLSAVESPNEFLQAITKALPSFQFFPNYLSMLHFLFKWVGMKADQMIKRGATDFEDLRTSGLQFINDQTDADTKSQIVHMLIQFKNVINQKQQAYRESIIGSEESKATVEVEVPKPKIIEQPKTMGQLIVDTLDRDFDKGLLMIKATAQNIESFDFNSKELVFKKLLNLITSPQMNSQQQYQQAYSLQALLWLREEVFGVEDSFQFTSLIMIAYAQAELQEPAKDSSVELYILNHWVKDLSLRDLIDRISAAATQSEKCFIVLFKWFLNSKLNQDSWNIEDFRKISILLAKNLKSDLVSGFFNQATIKCGVTKVQDFMEIQLMHNQREYNEFVNWFSQKYLQKQESTTVQLKERLRLPQIIQTTVEETKAPMPSGRHQPKYDDVELRNALASPFPSNNMDNAPQSSNRPHSGTMDHSKLYKQLREQRKFSNQKKQNDDDNTGNLDNKYDQIIGRLEAQLKPSSAIDEPSRPKTRSTSRGELNQRYKTVMDETEEEDLDKSEPFIRPFQPTADDPSTNLKEEQAFEEAQNKLKASCIKETLYRSELEQLEREKLRLDKEKQLLLQEKNHESREWQRRYDQMQRDHEEVMTSLKEANKSYMTQVSENEELKGQLKMMQMQHKIMMDKFAQFEEKLMLKEQQHQQQLLEQAPKIVKEERINEIKNTFNLQQITREGEANDVTTMKIQELLLNFREGKKLTQEEISEPLYVHYQSLKSQDQRFFLVQALHNALDQSEDVLFALPLPTYQAVLDFTMRVFASEKAKLEERTIRTSSAQNRPGTTTDQNEITIETQKIVSKLLNSKEFTTSLVSLIEILRNVMPADLYTELSSEQKQHLKVILRCISRVNKALPTENPDLIRAFDVLIEMQKLFQKNPPESLREDLPSLEDFDLLYRGLKDVADRMMELQPLKVQAFLDFVANSSDSKKNDNVFVKYMRQVMGTMRDSVANSKIEQEYDYGESEYHDDHY